MDISPISSPQNIVPLRNEGDPHKDLIDELDQQYWFMFGFSNSAKGSPESRQFVLALSKLRHAIEDKPPTMTDQQARDAYNEFKSQLPDMGMNIGYAIAGLQTALDKLSKTHPEVQDLIKKVDSFNTDFWKRKYTTEEACKKLADLASQAPWDK